MKHLLLALALACAGCVGNPKLPSPIVPGSSYVLVGVPESDTACTGAALEWMGNVPELQIRFSASEPPACPNCIWFESVPSAVSDAACFSAHADLGCTFRLPYISDSSRMMVANDVDEARRAYSCRHELGHAMGLFHPYEKTGVLMDPSFATASHVVTADDVAQWYRVRGR